MRHITSASCKYVSRPFLSCHEVVASEMGSWVQTKVDRVRWRDGEMVLKRKWGFSLSEVKTQLRTPPPPHHIHFMALSLGPPGWASARREVLDFMVQGKITRSRHTDHPAGCHSIWTNQYPLPPSPHFFYRSDALPATQPTVSKH